MSAPSTEPLREASSEQATLAGAGVEPAGTHETGYGARLGRYIVLERLGAGGMGVVFAAYDPGLDRRIALKLVERGAGSAIASLAAEARTLARLDHRGIVTVYDVGENDGGLFIAMEHLAGVTLRERLAGRPGWREVVPRFIAAADALAAAHRAGVVHGDFKPDNVMVTGTERERVVVLDFGLARLESSADADEGPLAPRGTPAYVSPEQIAGARPDARSDQFSFCVALFEALCGARPFAITSFASAAVVFDAQPVVAFPAGVRLPRWLRAAITRGLAIDPAARWPSMGALAAALEHGAKRRRRQVLIAAGIGLVAAATGFGIAQERRCLGAGAEVERTWNADVRAAIDERVGRELADLPREVWTDAADRIDARAIEIASWMRSACETRSAEPEALAARRRRCIDRAHASVHGLVDGLHDPAPQVMRRSIAAIALLESTPCDDDEQLVQFSPAHADPAHRAALAELEAALARAIALPMLRELAEGERELDALVVAARELDEPALVAEALVARGTLTTVHRGPTAGYEHVRRGLAAAETAGLDVVRARAWLAIAANRTSAREDAGLVAIAFEEVEGVLARSPWAIDVRISLEYERGRQASTRREYEEAIEHYSTAIELARSHGATQGMPAAMQGRIFALLNLDRLQGIGALTDELLAVRERAFGPDHPETAISRSTAAIVYAELGQIDRAIELSESSLRTMDAWGGRALVNSMGMACNYCRVLERACRRDRVAQACRDCLARSLEVRDPSAPMVWSGRWRGLLALLATDDGAGRELLARMVAQIGNDTSPAAQESLSLLQLWRADLGERGPATAAARALLEREASSATRLAALLVLAEHATDQEERAEARERLAALVDDPDMTAEPYLNARLLLVLAGDEAHRARVDPQRLADAVAQSCSQTMHDAWLASPARR